MKVKLFLRYVTSLFISLVISVGCLVLPVLGDVYFSAPNGAVLQNLYEDTLPTPPPPPKPDPKYIEIGVIITDSNNTIVKRCNNSIGRKNLLPIWSNQCENDLNLNAAFKYGVQAYYKDFNSLEEKWICAIPTIEENAGLIKIVWKTLNSRAITTTNIQGTNLKKISHETCKSNGLELLG